MRIHKAQPEPNGVRLYWACALLKAANWGVPFFLKSQAFDVENMVSIDYSGLRTDVYLSALTEIGSLAYWSFPRVEPLTELLMLNRGLGSVINRWPIHVLSLEWKLKILYSVSKHTVISRWQKIFFSLFLQAKINNFISNLKLVISILLKIIY